MAKKICSNCGSTSSPVLKTKGSFLIEIILWFCAIVPGLIYTIRRSSSRERVCRHCGESNMIPINSPLGKKLMEEIAVK